MRKCPGGRELAEGASIGPVHQASSRDWRDTATGAVGVCVCAAAPVAGRIANAPATRFRKMVEAVRVRRKPERICIPGDELVNVFAGSTREIKAMPQVSQALRRCSRRAKNRTRSRGCPWLRHRQSWLRPAEFPPGRGHESVAV